MEAADWDFCLECCSAPAVGDLAEAEEASGAEGLEAEAEALVDLGAEVRAAAEPVAVGSGS